MSERSKSLSTSEVRNWLMAYVAQLLSMPKEDVDCSFPFQQYGLDSSAAVGLSGDLGELLQHDFQISLAYEHPTIDAIVDHLVSSNLVEP